MRTNLTINKYGQIMRPSVSLMTLISLAGLTACSGGKNADVVSTYAQIVEASYTDSLTAAVELDEAINSFLADPTAAGLASAQQAWLDSREPYLQTEVYRFYDGPIDNPTDGPEGLLNAWPLDENYIDYVDGDAGAGIINDTAETIDEASLEALNGVGGESNVATGYHAIEFLLWGQDFSDNGPGERPHTDYVSGANGTAENQDRRGEYLNVSSALLIKHLTQVNDAWLEGADYRTEFESDADAGIEKILTGMIVLSGFETGGERLQASLDSGDQDDEHSCFSDNTHRDMVQDVRGIMNVWKGTYTALDGSVIEGPGIYDVVLDLDSDLAARLDAQIVESLELANALKAPYDQEIAPDNAEGNARVQALIQSLRDQETMLEEVFVGLGLSVPVSE